MTLFCSYQATLTCSMKTTEGSQESFKCSHWLRKLNGRQASSKSKQRWLVSCIDCNSLRHPQRFFVCPNLIRAILRSQRLAICDSHRLAWLMSPMIGCFSRRQGWVTKGGSWPSRGEQRRLWTSEDAGGPAARSSRAGWESFRRLAGCWRLRTSMKELLLM